MKKFNKFLIPALALGLFAACSDDKMDNPATPEDNTNVDRVQYLNISICSSSTTGGRAGDITEEKFQPGDNSENLIRDAFFVFYDLNGNYLAQKKLTKDELGDPTSQTGNTEELYKKTISIEIEKGKPNPAYVMCYLNPVDIDGDGTNALASKTIGDIKKIKRGQVFKKENDNTYFGMSNAVYYANDGKLVRATAIPEGALKSTETEANKADVPSVKIYVERYAAKVGVRTAKDNVVEGTTVGDYTLEFVPKKWLLNAREKEFFVSKSYTATATGDGMGSMGAENATTDQVGLTSWTWNDETNKRSYWARSVSYFWNKFPEVSSDVNNIDGLPLTYYTYNEIINNGYDVIKDGNSVYALENTIGKNAANSDNTLAALSSVVIAGEYKLKKGTETYSDGVTFYVLDGKHVYFKHDDSNKKTDDKALHQGLLAKNTTLVRRSGTGTDENPYKYTPVTDPSETELAIFEIYNVAEEFNSPGTKYNEQEVSIKVKAGASLSGLNLYYYDNGNHVELTSDKIDAMNKKLLADIGTADAYTAGKCFFSIPIRHIGFYRSGNPNNAENAVMDWTKIEEGDFGIVRNHIYDLSISSIKGLANGVFKPENPIVPERTKTTYVAKYDLYIESWKCVRTQHVEL